MTDRSANATIKGYFYQFDHTIKKVLEASSPQASFVVEGIEDIDVVDGDEGVFVQCKYYEGSEYNHSVIKDAVIAMLRHFHKNGCSLGQKARYRLHGHFKSGQEKLPAGYNLDFLKKNFLTYKQEKVTHEVHTELGLTKEQLAHFQSLLVVDVSASSYDEQYESIIELLKSCFLGSATDDAKHFYYPNAINVVQRLAIQADESHRRITKAQFLRDVDQKELVFSQWLRKMYGDAHYAKLIKRRHFHFRGTKVPPAARFLIVDMGGEFELPKAKVLLDKIAHRLSHVERQRTPPADRFCPFVLLQGIEASQLVSLKTELRKQGIGFTDGYPFNGAVFDPNLLAGRPTKENQLKLKFIPSEDQIKAVAAAISGSVIEIFDFYKAAPLAHTSVPSGVSHHAIRVNSAYLIEEVI